MTELTDIIDKYTTSDEMNSIKKERILSEVNSNSPSTILRSPLLHDKTPGTVSTPINCNDDMKESNPDEERTVTTPRRNSVKRNLNKSFVDVHDYSIIEPAAEDSLKVKLRKSTRRTENSPASTVRKSTRNIQRKSYADYISPLNVKLEDCYSPKFSERTSKVVRSLDLSEDALNRNVS